MFVENLGKMVNVFFVDIFYVEVVNAEGEGDGAPIVSPEARCGRALMVAMFVEVVLRVDSGRGCQPVGGRTCPSGS